MSVLVSVDDHHIVFTKVAIQDRQSERILNQPLDRPLERARAELLVVAVREQQPSWSRALP